MNYQEYESQPLTPGADPADGLAPPWLANPKGQAWLKAFGASKDGLVALTKDAVKARFPGICPDDALPMIGQERMMPRGYTESLTNYRARLLDAWRGWGWAGTPYGVLLQFRTAGFPSVRLQTQGGQAFRLRDELTGDPLQDVEIANIGTIDLGGIPENWSDFAVLITKAWPGWWGGVVPGDDSDDAAFARQLISHWKPAFTRCVKLVVIGDGPVWGIDLVWGAFEWNGGALTVWTPPSD